MNAEWLTVEVLRGVGSIVLVKDTLTPVLGQITLRPPVADIRLPFDAADERNNCEFNGSSVHYGSKCSHQINPLLTGLELLKCKPYFGGLPSSLATSFRRFREWVALHIPEEK